jgi:chromosome segregation ATPase
MFGWFKKGSQEVELVKANAELEGKIADLKAKLKEKKTVTASAECDCRDKLQDLVKNEAGLRKEIADLEKEKRKAKEELATTKLDHKMTIEDIKHMQKMLDEKNELALDRKVFEAEKACETEIKAIRKEYADKLEKELTVERTKMQAFMERVMEALPNVNVKLGGKVG